MILFKLIYEFNRTTGRDFNQIKNLFDDFGVINDLNNPEACR